MSPFIISNYYSNLQFIYINNQQIRTSSHLSVISSSYNNPRLINPIFLEDRYWINGQGQFEWKDQNFNIAIYLGNNNWRFEKTRIGSLSFVELDAEYKYFDGVNILPFLSTTLDKHALTHEPTGSDPITKFDGGVF